jgi:hypothetical protein
MYFFYFRSSKICISPTNVISLLFPLRCRLSSVQHRHTTTPFHSFFPWSQNELVVSALSSVNTSSCCLPFRDKIKALNSQYRRRSLSPDSQIHTLHCYKNTVSILASLSTTQSSLFCLLRAPYHQSSTHHCPTSLPTTTPTIIN